MRLTFPLLLILHILPALASLLVFGAYPSWILAAIVVPSFIAILGSSASKPQRLLACFLSWLAGLGIVSLITALYLQGEGFNERFFYHFNLESLMIGFDAYPFMPVSAGLFMLASLFLPWFLPKKLPFALRRPKTTATALGAASLLLFPPAVSAGSYLFDSYQREQSGETRILHEYRDVEVLPLTSKPKNLILIYAESLEQAWFDESLFPGLMRTIGPLRAQALEFTDTRQVDGTQWTMAGIVASQCSLPFNVQYFDGEEANVGLASVENPFDNEICLGDILDAYGYENIFMGGAPLSFAGKGNFLTTNGFDQALGFEELRSNVPEWWEYRNGWGLYDDSLIDIASTKVDELLASDAPFMLNILTVDTHQPSGHIPKNCGPYTEDNDILRAVHCNDRIVGGFIEGLLSREDLDDTLIVLFSDHLALRNTAWDRIAPIGADRRLSWMVWGKDIKPGVNTAAATHFDVTPTLLELMGIPNYHENNWGRSVLSGNDGYWLSKDNVDRESAKDVSYLDMEGQSAVNGISIDSETQTVSIGSKSFKATRGGLALEESIFMLLMKPSGAVDAVLFAYDMEQFERISKDFTVIAVSLDKALAPDATPTSATLPPLYYYVGTPSQSIAITGVAQGQVKLSGQEMKRVLENKAP